VAELLRTVPSYLLVNRLWEVMDGHPAGRDSRLFSVA